MTKCNCSCIVIKNAEDEFMRSKNLIITILILCFLLLITTGIFSKTFSPSKRKSVIEEAKKYFGTPYVMGGITPKGFDCSGFVYFIYKKIGMTIPRNSFKQYEKLPKSKEPKPGDLVFFQTYKPGASHVGIYAGNNQFIHAPKAGAKVGYGKFNEKYWKTKYLGSRSVFSDAAILKIKDQTRFSGRFEFSSLNMSSAGTNALEAEFGVSFGFSIDFPLENDFALSIRPMLDLKVVDDSSNTWIPVALRIPVIAKYYLVNEYSFGMSLMGGIDAAFLLSNYTDNPGIDMFNKFVLSITLGICFEIKTYSIDFKYEYGIFDYMNSLNLSKFSIGFNFEI